jgi:ABC-type glycerol-3-phosphate transport system permease component
MTLTALDGYFAASLVFATFCTKRMVPLRTIAIVSNIAFIIYGYLGGLWPILILHTALLPMNIHRLRQEVLLERPGDIMRRLRIVTRRRCSTV